MHKTYEKITPAGDNDDDTDNDGNQQKSTNNDYYDDYQRRIYAQQTANNVSIIRTHPCSVWTKQ